MNAVDQTLLTQILHTHKINQFKQLWGLNEHSLSHFPTLFYVPRVELWIFFSHKSCGLTWCWLCTVPPPTREDEASRKIQFLPHTHFKLPGKPKMKWWMRMFIILSYLAFLLVCIVYWDGVLGVWHSELCRYLLLMVWTNCGRSLD